MSSNQKSHNNTNVLEPSETPREANEHTSLDPTFMEGNAPEQVFHFRKWGLSYGTDDKGHAAALILSVILAILLGIIFAIGLFVDRSWIPDAIKIVGTALTLTTGVAIGKSTSSKSN